MPNNMSPKGILVQQAEVPKVALSKTPLSALGEGITGVLANIAGGLPEMGAVPAPAMAPAALTNLFKSLEATLPTGFPKMTEALGKMTQGGGAQRGTVTEEQPAAGGVATRGTL